MHATSPFENDTELDLQVQSKHKFVEYQKKPQNPITPPPKKHRPISSSDEVKTDKQQKKSHNPLNYNTNESALRENKMGKTDPPKWRDSFAGTRAGSNPGSGAIPFLGRVRSGP